LLCIELGKQIQRIIEGEEIDASSFGERHTFIERQRIAPIPLCGISLSGIIHENLAHQVRCGGEEVFAILKARILLGEAQVRLMDQSCALERMVWPFVTEVVVRHAAQFVVNDWKQATQRFFVASTPIGQKFG